MKKSIMLLLILLMISTVVMPAFAGNETNIQFYSIKKGDTLLNIATAYKTTVVKLLELNPGITPNNLGIGQRITVPSEVPLYSYHVVQAKDNVRSISKQYQVPVNELLAANNMTNRKLEVGQTIRIPVNKMDRKPTTPKPTEELTTYVVKAGDTYYALAKKFNTTITKLMELNHQVPAEQLVVGTTLRLPAQHKEVTHTVEIGDTLFKVAKQYSVTLGQLMEWNKLSDANVISAGQKLVIKLPVS